VPLRCHVPLFCGAGEPLERFLQVELRPQAGDGIAQQQLELRIRIAALCLGLEALQSDYSWQRHVVPEGPILDGVAEPDIGDKETVAQGLGCRRASLVASPAGG
jgi:hypothetical protein